MSPSSGSGGDAGASVIAGSSIGAASVTLVRPRCGTRSAAGLRLPQRAASEPPTPPGAGGSSTRQSLRLLDVAVEGKTTLGVGPAPLSNSTHFTQQFAKSCGLRVLPELTQTFAKDTQAPKASGSCDGQFTVAAHWSTPNVPFPRFCAATGVPLSRSPNPIAARTNVSCLFMLLSPLGLVMKARTFRGEPVVLPVRARGRDRCCD